ncbi:MAG: beta-N-acetylhexosaminidase, partial [Candidatus Rokuibacteriota bacterium]
MTVTSKSEPLRGLPAGISESSRHARPASFERSTRVRVYARSGTGTRARADANSQFSRQIGTAARSGRPPRIPPVRRGGSVRIESVTDIADMVGERLMIGLAGSTLTEADVDVFRETRAAGLILYRRNFEGPAALATLLDSLESALGRRLLVATDHEGGRIVMLGRGTTIFPDNLALGTAGEEAFAFKQGLFEARELRRLGIDLNLGPCLDVLTDRYSPNIGIRSYGKDPAIVTRYGVARIRGMARGGLSACAKHFPGKGHSPLDAHLRLPTIDSSPEEMRATHLPPFVEAIAAGIESLMTSHPVYPKLDPSGVPATFSRRRVGDWLRGELGFGGVIVSDDVEMGAVSEACPIGEAAVRAAAAGHDLLLVCHT